MYVQVGFLIGFAAPTHAVEPCRRRWPFCSLTLSVSQPNTSSLSVSLLSHPSRSRFYYFAITSMNPRVRFSFHNGVEASNLSFKHAKTSDYPPDRVEPQPSLYRLYPYLIRGGSPRGVAVLGGLTRVESEVGPPDQVNLQGLTPKILTPQTRRVDPATPEPKKGLR
jgi:hypothetical protein